MRSILDWDLKDKITVGLSVSAFAISVATAILGSISWHSTFLNIHSTIWGAEAEANKDSTHSTEIPEGFNPKNFQAFLELGYTIVNLGNRPVALQGIDVRYYRHSRPSFQKAKSQKTGCSHIEGGSIVHSTTYNSADFGKESQAPVIIEPNKVHVGVLRFRLWKPHAIEPDALGVICLEFDFTNSRGGTAHIAYLLAYLDRTKLAKEAQDDFSVADPSWYKYREERFPEARVF